MKIRDCLFIVLIFSNCITLNLHFSVISRNESDPSSDFQLFYSNDVGFDIIVFFQNEFPDEIHSEKSLVKLYKNFPVARFAFNNLEQKIEFYQKYADKIRTSEKNQPLIGQKNSLNYFSNSISADHIRETTFTSYLHDLNIKGERAKIGIVDTGVYSHPIELGDRVKATSVFVNTENGYSEDIYDASDANGHGTHVAGLAAGATTGIAPAADIYSAKIIHTFSVKGAGNGGGEETTAGILDAIDFLVSNSVDVINLSVGQYHNLNGGVRDEILNYISLMYNIVVTTAAGNSGTLFGDRGTLNNPGTSLQSLSVAATNPDCDKIADYSSHGPKIDYSMKPDISAPGTSLNGPSHIGTGYTTKSGTSMAAPIVAGGAALLIDYLKSINQTYTAGTIKVALMHGAQSLGESVWKEGAGFINLTRSFEYLRDLPKTGNLLDISYFHPKKLPIDPYEVLFTGTAVSFNLTIVQSSNTEMIINIPYPLNQNLKVSSSTINKNGTNLLEFNFTIPYSAEEEKISVNISVGLYDYPIEFEIRKPKRRILFDESLNRIARHGYGTDAFEIMGDSSSTIGMFSRFTRFLAYENNYSVTPHIKGDLTLSKLQKYDCLILANPFSNKTDKYMDWIYTPDNNYFSMSEKTAEAILEYVSIGGGVLIFNAEHGFFDKNALNNFLSPFGVQTSPTFVYSLIESSLSQTTNLTKNISSFPFRGSYLQATGDYTSVIGEYNGNPTIISYNNPNEGKILVFGTNALFDNIGFSSFAYFGNLEENQILAFNSVAWLAEGDLKEPNLKDKESIPVNLPILLSLFTLFPLFLIAFYYSRKRKA